MQIDARSEPNLAKAPGESEASAEVIYCNLLADKTGVDGGHGTTDNQNLGSNDLGSPLQLSFVPPSDPGGMPVATDGDESANAGEGLSAAPLLASSDTSADPVHPTLDPFEPLLTEASTVSGSVIGTQIQDFNAGYPSVGFHIAPPADSGFMATAAVLFGPATSAAATGALANLAPMPFGAHGAEASSASVAHLKQSSDTRPLIPDRCGRAGREHGYFGEPGEFGDGIADRQRRHRLRRRHRGTGAAGAGRERIERQRLRHQGRRALRQLQRSRRRGRGRSGRGAAVRLQHRCDQGPRFGRHRRGPRDDADHPRHRPRRQSGVLHRLRQRAGLCQRHPRARRGRLPKSSSTT